MHKILIALAAATCFCATAAAAEYRSHTIKFAVTTPKGTPPVQGMELFAEKVAERSGGKIKVRLFPNGVLGGDAQVLSSLQGGVVEMMMWSAGNLVTQVPDFGLLDLPFLYTDPQKVDVLLDGEVGDRLIAQLPQRQLVGLAFWELGMRHLTNNVRPVGSPEDASGIKIRLQESPVSVDTWRALGANPTPLPFTEVHTALETGTVDGQENPATVILSAKFNEVQKYLSLTRHSYNAHMVLVGKPFWDRLNTDEQQLLKDVAMEIRLEQRRLSRENDAKVIAELEQAGMQVNHLDEEALSRFREQLRPVILEHANKINPELTQKAFEIVGFDAQD
ncbi:MAG: TRAP transporter substrate-binding protein [Corticimicrobacter sp.]|uniref:TRAP transporter substrate-binding protein n=1 Tax=Corticimicrobacter sp. TaxID=2678536 RepID=UPI0032DA0F9F